MIKSVSPFERYARGAKRTAFTAIPVVDLGPLFGGDAAARRHLEREIDDVCRHVGFFYVKNHGVAPAVIAAAFDAAKKFFARPLDEKMLIHYKKARNRVRGYVPLMQTHADRSARPDRHEGFDYALDLPADDPDYAAGNRLYGPNQWPARPPEFRAAIGAYFETNLTLGRALFRAFAGALGLPDDFFDDKITKPLAQGRVLHYPPHDALDDEAAWGIGAHTDYECFTLLAQDPAGGLQVRNAAGEWIEAPPLPGTFVVNLGDMMKRWTNGLYQSTPHRVLNRSGRERYSLVLFYGANYDAEITCLPTCHDSAHPPQFDPIRQGEWTERQLRSTYFSD